MKGRTTLLWLLPIPLLLWIFLISQLSSQPYKDQSIQPMLKRVISEEKAKELLPDWTIRYAGSTVSAKQKPYRFIEFVFRKGSHVLVYSVLMVVAHSAAKLVTRNLGLRFMLGLVLVGVTALLDEYNQLQSGGGRTGMYQDVLLDLAGALAVCICILFYYFIRNRLRRRR